METWFSVSKAAKYLGVSAITLRRWEEKGILVPERTLTGHRRYSLSQLESVQGKKRSVSNKTIYLYARVSTQKQANQGNLERQIGRLTEYAVEHGFSIQGIYSDVASGLNENRRGLEKLLQTIKQKPTVVLIEYKDRLARFGFAYLERYIQDFGGSIQILEQQEKDENQELVEDLIAITNSFSARIYGKRGGRVAKRIETIIKEGNSDHENDDSSLSL